MSIGKKVFREVSWLALFKFICQAFSWVTTIYVARILLPSDYGLMSMATIFTGYVMIFSELGLGAAIIQKDKITEKELSSIFWFVLLVSVVFSAFCFAVAKPTASLFDEQKIVSITQAVSIIFIFSGLSIVPLGILKRKMDFKSVGMIEMLSTLVSCFAMILIALSGGGVWTLIGGNIIRVIITTFLLFFKTKWLPLCSFSFSDTKQLINFGAIVAVSRSFYYGFTHVDIFFIAKYFSSTFLGSYSFALQLVRMPTDKIVTLINQVSFSALSKIKDNNDEFKKLYLNIIKVTALIVAPLFIGGFVLGDKLVIVLLDNKWESIIDIFRYLCLVQIIVSLNAINNFVHFSKGRPKYGVYYNGSLTVLMGLSFYIAVNEGPTAILYPWFTTYLILSLSWIYITIRSIDITIKEYICAIYPATLSVLIMVLSIFVVSKTFVSLDISLVFKLFIEITAGFITYIITINAIDGEIRRKFKEIYIRNG